MLPTFSIISTLALLPLTLAQFNFFDMFGQQQQQQQQWASGAGSHQWNTRSESGRSTV
jgi:hypothetical protein